MDWLWVIIGIAVVIFVLSKRNAKKQEQREAQIAREFHDKRKYDKTSALKHYEKVMKKTLRLFLKKQPKKSQIRKFKRHLPKGERHSMIKFPQNHKKLIPLAQIH